MDFQKIADAWTREDQAVLDQLSAAQRRAVGIIAAGIITASPETEQALRSAGDEFVLGVKSTNLFRRVPSVMDSVERITPAKAYTIPWVLSEEKVDRAGDLIIQSGWQLENFKRNPVLLWGHAMGFDSDADIPIGRADNVRVEGKRLLGDLVFAVEESERAAQIYRLAVAGYVRAGSVGFRPLKINHIVDEAERSKIGLGRYGVVFEKQELLEFSPCAVPCLPSALQEGVKSGRINTGDADFFSALPQSERDLIKIVRRRARSFVDLGAARRDVSGEQRAPGGAGGVQPFVEPSDLASALREVAEAKRELVGAVTALRGAVSELALAREDDVASRRMLARSISNLSERVGAPRAVDSARPGADAGNETLGVEVSEKVNKHLEELTKLLAGKSGGKN